MEAQMIKKTYERFNESIYIIKLKNGMQVHILPKDDPSFLTYVEVSLPYGAIDLEYKLGDKQYQSPYGTAHFFEHKIFAMPEGDAFAYFSKLGADANAATSYNQTSYLFSATSNVIKTLTHLFNMLDNTYFTKENVNHEKNIVEQEIKMYLDDPHSEMETRLLEMMYHKHAVKHDVLGTIESINKIDVKVLDDVYNAFYNPSNRLVVIAGKIDLAAIKSFFKDYDRTNPVKHQKPVTILAKEPVHLVEKNKVLTKPIGIDKMMMGIKLNPKKIAKKDKLKSELSLAILLSMLLGPSSKSYEALMEQKLINQSFFMNVNHEKGASYIMLYAETKKVRKLKKTLIDLLVNEGESYLDEAEFKRVKKVFVGNFIYELNNIEIKAYYYGKYYHQGLSLFDSMEHLANISYEDILDAYQRIKKNQIATLIYKKA